MNLLALCRGNALEVKRIPVANPLQTQLQNLFQTQENDFRQDRPNEVAFNGEWNPDADEMLTIANTPETAVMVQASQQNVVGLQAIDTANFEAENISALFMSFGTGAQHRLLVQRFTAQQRLSRRLAILLEGQVFRELSEPAFTVGTKLTCIVEGGQMKFQSYSNLRMIFDLSQLYQQATDQDIDAFSTHAAVNFDDLDLFKTNANQTIRKLVHKVHSTGVLNNYAVNDIRDRAQATGLNINVVNGAIQVPQDPTEAKRFLRFLDDGLYEAPLSGLRYVTNSKRAI